MKPSLPVRTLFDWSTKHASQLALPAFMLLSITLHLTLLAIFRIAPPASFPKPRTHATAYALLTSTSQGRSHLPSLATSDPSLFSPTQIEERGLSSPDPWQYQPILDSLMPSLRTLSNPPKQKLVPPPPPATPLISIEDFIPAQNPTPHTPHQPLTSRFLLPPHVTERLITLPPLKNLSVPEKLGILPATFLTSFSPDGTLAHCFLLHSSGHPPLDQKASSLIRKISLSPSQSPLWTTIHVLWGADLIQLKPE